MVLRCLNTIIIPALHAELTPEQASCLPLKKTARKVYKTYMQIRFDTH